MPSSALLSVDVMGSFCVRYKLLAADPRMPPLADSCKRICEKSGIKGFQIGKTKVFLKYYHIDTLVEELEKVQRAAINVQKSKEILFSDHVLCLSHDVVAQLFEDLLQEGDSRSFVWQQKTKPNV